MIWRYKVPMPDGTTEMQIGCPVSIHIPGAGWVQVVYQFMPCAVVHLQSGKLLARVTDEDKGHPQQRAQSAWSRRWAELPEAARRQAWARMAAQERLNVVPESVGVMAQPDER